MNLFVQYHGDCDDLCKHVTMLKGHGKDMTNMMVTASSQKYYEDRGYRVAEKMEPVVAKEDKSPCHVCMGPVRVGDMYLQGLVSRKQYPGLFDPLTRVAEIHANCEQEFNQCENWERTDAFIFKE